VIEVSTALTNGHCSLAGPQVVNSMSLPLCTIPAGVYGRGMGQDPVILSGGDPNAGMLGRDPWCSEGTTS